MTIATVQTLLANEAEIAQRVVHGERVILTLDGVRVALIAEPTAQAEPRRSPRRLPTPIKLNCSLTEALLKDREESRW